MRTLVDDNMRFVERTLRNAGVRDADLDDEIQRTFMVVAARLEDVEPGAERSFLFQVAFNTALHARRSRARNREIACERLPEAADPLATPEHLAHRKQMRELLDSIVDTMHDSERLVFTLYEHEEMSMTEIAALLQIPRGTVASRLRRARARFRKHVAAIRRAWDAGTETQFDDPRPIRRERLSRLEEALLGAGASSPASEKTHQRTLAACLAFVAA